MSNSMLDILKNFDSAEKGEKPAGPAEVGSMKAILESIQAVEECGDMPMQQAMPQKEGNPVTMNVSLTASGKENVDELMALMKMAGVQSAEPHAHDAGSDMEKLKMLMAPEEELELEDIANEPEEEYSDHEYMTKDLSGGINREKKQFKASQRGDNAMAVESIKNRLWAALNEKKKPDENNNGIPDYAEDGKGPNDLKKKKKKK